MSDKMSQCRQAGELVERVMAAIRPLIEDECNCDPGEYGGRTIAEAAIAAMREPTRVMMLAADVSPQLRPDGAVRRGESMSGSGDADRASLLERLEARSSPLCREAAVEIKRLREQLENAI